MRFPILTSLLVAIVLLSGCGPGSDTGSVPPKPSIAPAPASESAPTKDQAIGIWFDPAALSACARPAKVAVHWDASSFAEAKTVDIFAVNKAGKEQLFLSAGRTGTRDSGEWMRAGSKMVLRNKADGAELATATVESIPCTK